MTSMKASGVSWACPLKQLRYVRLPVQLTQPAAAFATDVLGLQHVPNDLEPCLYRSDDRYYTLCFATDAERPSIGIEISDEHEFDRIAEALVSDQFRAREATKDQCAKRFVRRALIIEDATGNEIDLVLRPYQSGRRYFPSRDAGVTGFQGAGLRSRAMKDDLRLWTMILGAKITDRVGEITYLGIDQMHHRVVLYPSDRAGLVYVSYGVESMDALMQNHYFVEERQIKILHGPGREPASGQIFVRFVGPEGYVFSYGYGLGGIEPDHRPRQFTLEASSLCEWGSKCADISELRAKPAE
jgi:2,3-dihydroxy-p-cumate/2,3-dihydroxybenzoate 3,4-dioxygenase